jgi:hypothetical protein
MAAMSDILALMQDADDILSNKNIAGTAGTLQTRALRSVNRAVDLLEAIMARYDDLWSTLDDTVSTAATRDYVTAPSRLMRIDRLYLLNSSGQRKYRILPGYHTHGAGVDDVGDLLSTTNVSSGQPRSYWWDRGQGRIYFNRKAAGVDTLRFLAFIGKADMTLSPDTTWAYPDSLLMPVALMASRVFQFRTDDDVQELQAFANAHLVPVIEQMKRQWPDGRDEPRGNFASW